MYLVVIMDEFGTELLYVELIENLELERIRQDKLNILRDMQCVIRCRVSKEMVVKLVCKIEDSLEDLTNINGLLAPIEQILLVCMWKLLNNDGWSGTYK